MANGTDSNTSGAFFGFLRPRALPKDDCLDPKLLAKIAGAMEVVVTAQSPTVIRSQTAPTDLRATWQLINAFGLPIGRPRQYSSATGQWEGARVVTSSTGASFCLSDKLDNRTTIDERGCIYTPGVAVAQISPRQPNLLQSDQDGWYVAGETSVLEISADPCNALKPGTDNKPFVLDQSWTYLDPFPANPYSQSVPCNGILLPGVPALAPPAPLDLRNLTQYNKDCHRYALIWAKIVIGQGNGFSSGSIDNPSAVIRAGHDGQEIVSMVDADGQEGSNHCEAWVRLNPDPGSRHFLRYHYQVRAETLGIAWGNAGGKDTMQAYLKALA